MDRRVREFIQGRLLTTEELARYIGVKPVTIQQWVRRGKADCVKKGRNYLFDRRDFEGGKRARGAGSAPDAP